MDVHSPEKRSFNMSRIKNKNSKPELFVRKLLWNNGYRYRLHKKDLPGNPDIVLSKYNTIVFVHGCFWHRHGCKYTTTPATRREFWTSKFHENTERDKKSIQNFRASGWRVLIIWECEIRENNKDDLRNRIENFLHQK